MSAELFNTFVQACPPATVPLSGSEPIAISQGGVTKQVPASAIVSSSAMQATAQVSTTGIGADIPNTTLRTPAVKTKYRVNVWALTTTVDAAAGVVRIAIGWQSENGATGGYFDNGGLDLTTLTDAGRIGFFVAVPAGIPLRYSCTVTTVYGAARYSLYITVEECVA